VAFHALRATGIGASRGRRRLHFSGAVVPLASVYLLSSAQSPGERPMTLDPLLSRIQFAFVVAFHFCWRSPSGRHLHRHRGLHLATGLARYLRVSVGSGSSLSFGMVVSGIVFPGLPDGAASQRTRTSSRR
jgi:hypothetical protein